jgi:hypothetical protein
VPDSFPEAGEPAEVELGVDDELHPASASAPAATQTPVKVLMRRLGPRRLPPKLTRPPLPSPAAAPLPLMAFTRLGSPTVPTHYPKLVPSPNHPGGVIKSATIPASETASTFCLVATISSSKSTCMAQAFTAYVFAGRGPAGPHDRGVLEALT